MRKRRDVWQYIDIVYLSGGHEKCTVQCIETFTFHTLLRKCLSMNLIFLCWKFTFVCILKYQRFNNLSWTRSKRIRIFFTFLFGKYMKQTKSEIVYKALYVDMFSNWQNLKHIDLGLYNIKSMKNVPID